MRSQVRSQVREGRERRGGPWRNQERNGRDRSRSVIGCMAIDRSRVSAEVFTVRNRE